MKFEEFVSTDDLCKRYGRSPRTLYRWQRLLGFPRPVVPGGHGAQSRWRESDVKTWEDSRVSQS